MSNLGHNVYFESAGGYFERWDMASPLHPQKTLLVTRMYGDLLPPAAPTLEKSLGSPAPLFSNAIGGPLDPLVSPTRRGQTRNSSMEMNLSWLAVE